MHNAAHRDACPRGRADLEAGGNWAAGDLAGLELRWLRWNGGASVSTTAEKASAAWPTDQQQPDRRHHDPGRPRSDNPASSRGAREDDIYGDDWSGCQAFCTSRPRAGGAVIASLSPRMNSEPRPAYCVTTPRTSSHVAGQLAQRRDAASHGHRKSNSHHLYKPDKRQS